MTLKLTKVGNFRQNWSQKLRLRIHKKFHFSVVENWSSIEALILCPQFFSFKITYNKSQTVSRNHLFLFYLSNELV